VLDLLLPVAIFVAEVLVVTLNTLRVIAISRNMKVVAPLLGLVEIAVWLFAIGQIMKNLNDPVCYIAFAGGFTLGNYLGLWIEEKLALGHLVVRVITRRDAQPLIATLRASNHGVTHFNGHGATGPVQLVFTVIRRKMLPEVLRAIHAFDPRAFHSVDAIQATASGIFPLQRSRSRLPEYQLLAQEEPIQAWLAPTS
jgi:uncharacterized protein YebE (UPF0316 family)